MDVLAQRLSALIHDESGVMQLVSKLAQGDAPKQ